MATEYHVSLNGDNNNTCTLSNPFRTISFPAKIAKPGDNETKCIQKIGFVAEFELEEEGEQVFLNLELDNSFLESMTTLVTTERLGYTIVSDAVFENPDGTPFRLDQDYHGLKRNDNNPVPGPFENMDKRKMQIMIWKGL